MKAAGKALELSSNDTSKRAKALSQLAASHAALEQFDLAEKEYRNAIDLDPKRASLRRNLGALLEGQEKLNAR